MSFAPRTVSLIVCDDVRQEINGKLILIGVYTGDIVVSALPVTLTQLHFFIEIRMDSGDILRFAKVEIRVPGHEPYLVEIPEGQVSLPPSVEGLDDPKVIWRAGFPIVPFPLLQEGWITVWVTHDRGRDRAGATHVRQVSDVSGGPKGGENPAG